jgi:nucleoside permease NupC
MLVLNIAASLIAFLSFVGFLNAVIGTHYRFLWYTLLADHINLI